MKLHDKSPASESETHKAVWALIPWYVNGTLDENEVEEVKSHAKSCTLCAQEIGRQRVVAEKVVKTDPFDVPLARSWEKLRAQIDAEATARRPVRQSWLERLQGGRIAVMGGAALASLALVAVLQFSTGPSDDFITLTSDPGDAAQQIRIQPAANVDVEALREILAPYGVLSLDGPSEAGVYTVNMPDGTDMAATAEAMMAAPEVLFAAPGADQ